MSKEFETRDKPGEWLSVKDFAARKGISERAVRYSINKYEHKPIPHPKRHDQVTYEIWVEDDTLRQAQGDECGAPQNSNAELGNAELGNAELGNAELGNAELGNAELGNAEAQNAELKNAEARNAEAQNAEARNAEAQNAEAQNAETTLPRQCREDDLSCQDAAEAREPGQGARLQPFSGTALSLVQQSEKEEFEAYPLGSREIAYARLEIVKLWMDEKARAKADKLPIGKLEKAFMKQLELGKICWEATQRLMNRPGASFKISIRTLYRWEKDWKESGNLYPIVLTDKYSQNKINKEQQYARTRIKMLAAGGNGLRATEIYRECMQNVPGFDLHLKTVQRIVNETRKDHFLQAAVTGPTAWKNNARPHIRRINDCSPNDLSESDGKTMNVLVMSPFWFHNDRSMRYLVRPVLVAWIDVATWTITGWASWLSESWHLVRTSFEDSTAKFGVPRKVKYDGSGAFFNAWTDPVEFARRKSETATVKKARELLKRGYRGFYDALGVEHTVKTIPGNSESKQIEPAWGDIFGEWERRQFAYVGKDFTARPEWLKMTNIKLMKSYKDRIMTWDEYITSLGEYINEWNNRPRPSLRRLDGTTASPVECFMEFPDNIRKPARELVEHICWHPRKCVVQRDGIMIDGLLYRHPALGVYLGQSVLAEYDERNRFECTIATLSGEKLSTKGRLVIPGMHMDDEQSKLAYADRGRYEKELKAVYLARVNSGDKITMQELNSITARIDLLLEDQSRRQERDKADSMQEIRDKHRGRSLPNKPSPELEGGFESIDEEIASSVPIAIETIEPDQDDLLIAEVNKDLNKVGIRSISL